MSKISNAVRFVDQGIRIVQCARGYLERRALAVFAAVLLLGVFDSVCARAQTAEEPEQAVQVMKGKAAEMFNISEENAVVYLRTAVEAVRARKVANSDSSELSRLYADAMEQFSQAQIQGFTVIARGEKLLEKMKDGVPGTAIPTPLVQEINQWAAFAGNTLVAMAQANVAAVKWSSERLLQAAACDTKNGGRTLNASECLRMMREGVDLIKAIGDHMKSLVPATDVIKLGVQRLRY